MKRLEFLGDLCVWERNFYLEVTAHQTCLFAKIMVKSLKFLKTIWPDLANFFKNLENTIKFNQILINFEKFDRCCRICELGKLFQIWQIISFIYFAKYENWVRDDK